MNTPLDAMITKVEWGEFKLSELFDIEKTAGFNKDRLTEGSDYDYVTRTSQNQGILQTTGFVNKENINAPGMWSLGLLQMDFFYRKKPWYAGQFVRKVIPKKELVQNSALYLSAILNKQKSGLLSVLVRDVDQKFRETSVYLPIKNNMIDFDFMEEFIHLIEAQLISKVKAYLSAAGLNDLTLNDDEEKAIQSYGSLGFRNFKVTDIFSVRNSGNILSRDIKEDSGDTPYLCASRDNNSVSSYISYEKKYLDEGNCVFIGGKTFVVTYQEKDFYSNDSHNLILYLKDGENRTKLNQLFLATCIDKSLSHKYSWGDSISNKKIQKDEVALPSVDGNPDFSIMKPLISAVQKISTKRLIDYLNRKIK